jgi:hypothetical protein
VFCSVSTTQAQHFQAIRGSIIFCARLILIFLLKPRSAAALDHSAWADEYYRACPQYGRYGYRRVAALLFAVLFFGGWEYACRAYKISELIIPAPSQILIALIEGLRSGQLIDGLLTTMQEVVLGFALAAIMAFIIGTLISQIRLLELVIYPYIVAIQTLPKVAFAPLILIWVGLGIEGKVLISCNGLFLSDARQHDRRTAQRTAKPRSICSDRCRRAVGRSSATFSCLRHCPSYLRA